MGYFIYQVYELYPTENGEEKRFVWQFDDEEAAQGLINYIENNDTSWPCVKIRLKKKKFKGIDGQAATEL